MDCQDKSLRFTGRWQVTEKRAITTAPGAFFHLAFQGNYAVLHFATQRMSEPRPHLWIRVDGGVWTETAIDRHLTLRAKEAGKHVVQIVFKSAMETVRRWNPPLDGRLEFTGYDAEAPEELPADTGKTIEFVGDSITEGILVDLITGEEGWEAGPYQNDAMATYAWQAADILEMTPLLMGYGSVGVTKGGNGGVPKAAEAYPWCYNGAPASRGTADYIVIHHGTNDSQSGGEAFRAGYRELLRVISCQAPKARLFAMVPFCGVFRKELQEIVEEFRLRGLNRIDLIDTRGWKPAPEPIHPDREEHKRLGALLAAELDRLGVSSE